MNDVPRDEGKLSRKAREIMANKKPGEWQGSEESEIFGDTWNPEIMKALTGFYVGNASNQGKYSSNVYHIEQPDGSRYTVWGSKVINDEFAKIPLDAEVRIEFLGEKTSQDGTKYKAYRIEHRVYE